MDPITIIGIVAAILNVLFAASGPIMGKLWRAIRSHYGRACKSRRYLQALGQRRVSNDLQTMLLRDLGLARQAERYYIRGDNGFLSDFSDFSD